MLLDQVNLLSIPYYLFSLSINIKFIISHKFPLSIFFTVTDIRVAFNVADTMAINQNGV